MSIDANVVARKVDEVRELIDRFAIRPVRIVAVTKRFGVDAVEAALAAGVADIGENYAQELLGKSAELDLGKCSEAPRWHFVGHVQRNKVAKLAGIVKVWHSVDTPALGAEIAKRAPGAEVLVQVNTSRASTQGGVSLEAVPALVEDLRRLDLDVRGLMTIGAAGDGDLTETSFGNLRSLADDLELSDCSMGMSGDLEQALRAGTTMVRLGTALFGPRPG